MLSGAACPGANSQFDGSTFDTAAATSNLAAGLEALDRLGRKLNYGGVSYVPGQSNHRVGVFLKKIASGPNDRWDLRLLAKGEEFGRPAGSTIELGVYVLLFNPATGQLSFVNGDPPNGLFHFELGGALTGPFVVAAGETAAPAFSLVLRLTGIQEVFWTTPFNTPGFTHFLAGSGFTPGEPGLPTSRQLGACGDDGYCGLLWNSATLRFEGTSHTDLEIRGRGRTTARSDWQTASDTLFASKGFVLTSPASGEPNPISPTLAACGGSVAVDVQVGLADQVIMVMDRSGSMSENVVGPQGGGQTRLAFMKAAANAFIDLQASNRTATDVALMSFNDSVTLDQDFTRVDATNPPPPPPPTRLTPSAYKAKVATLAAAGWTAIGTALKAARDRFSTAPAGSKAIILMSDGENNRGAEDPVAETAALRAAGVAIFGVPLGTSADRGTMTAIGGLSAGRVFDAPVGDEMPAVYAELFARVRGEAPTLVRTASAVQASFRCIEGEFSCPVIGTVRTVTPFGCYCLAPGEAAPTLPGEQDFTIPVEPGAERLHVTLSTRNAQTSTWNPAFELRNPAGVLILDNSSSSVLQDAFYRILNIDNPVAGDWKLKIKARNNTTLFSYLVAHVENPGPDCQVAVSSARVAGTDNLVVTGRAYNSVAIGEGATFTGLLRRPNGSTVPLAFQHSRDPSRGDTVVVSPSQYVGRGLYEVTLRCQVSPGATPYPGESILNKRPLAAGEVPATGPSAIIHPFVREARTSFFVNTTTQPPLPPGGDCDKNGIPDSQETSADSDADGLPDICDDDDDADDVPDANDPAPKDPGAPCQFGGCVVANAGPDQILQCTAGGATAQMDASASREASGGVLTYSWSAPGITFSNSAIAMPAARFPRGSTTATVAVAHPGGAAASDTVQITVLDTSPPILVVPPDITTSSCNAPNIGSATATDACGGSVTLTSNKPAKFPLGTTVVTYWAVDQFGNAASATQRVTAVLGDNSSCCPAGTTVRVGTSNNDVINGTSGSDCILGLGAQDTINGLGGNDYISGGEGNDIIDGGSGADRVYGGNGQDQLMGGTGADFIDGEASDDQCWGGDDNDVIRGGLGQDRLFGENGNDQLAGDDGDDTLEGGVGDDALDGGGLHDICNGGAGTDTFSLCEVTTQ